MMIAQVRAGSISNRVNSTLSKLINCIHRTCGHDDSIGQGWLHLLQGSFHPVKTIINCIYIRYVHVDSTT
jgi:hypothetical protein